MRRFLGILFYTLLIGGVVFATTMPFHTGVEVLIQDGQFVPLEEGTMSIRVLCGLIHVWDYKCTKGVPIGNPQWAVFTGYNK